MANSPVNFSDPLKAGAIQPLIKASLAKPAPKETPRTAPEVDRVELSPTARELAVLRARLQQIPEVRKDVVEEVRAKLATIANTAALNAKLAEKLLLEN